MTKSELGAWGEEKAATFLRRKGYRILEQNFRCRQGEIDIIARKRETIAFVEVKLRKNAEHGEAREFVTYSKQSRILLTAQLWMSQHEGEYQPRFDVIEVYAPQGINERNYRIEHLENAFE